MLEEPEVDEIQRWSLQEHKEDRQILVDLVTTCEQLRTKLGRSEEHSITTVWRKFARESSDKSNPHRRGPRKLCAALVTEAEGLEPSTV